jgi:hypothetical protein
MIHARSRAQLTLLLFLCASCLAGCPLPIARTETASAPVVGSILLADGTPASGLEIRVSTEWNDDHCVKPVVHASTDAAGQFQLPATEKHYSTTWFVPNLDVGQPQFRVCATVGDTSRAAYVGYGSRFNTAMSDSISCVVWQWAGSARVSCSGHARQSVVTGGHWTDSVGERGEGFYRLFLTDEPTRVKGYREDKPQERPYVYVQWVEPRVGGRAEAGQPIYRVRQTVPLPIDPNRVGGISKIQVWRREGRWMASLEGYKHAFMNDFARAELVFELGSPGKAQLIAGP